MKRRWIVGGYVLLACYTLAPIAGGLTAGVVAHLCGAALDEGGPHPCVILGTDVGVLLNELFVGLWFAFITVPTGLIALVLYTIILWAIRRKVRATISQ